MKKEHSLSVLLVVVFFVIFVPTVEAAPSGLFASAAPGLRGSANEMLQFKAGGHVLGFQPKKVYFASPDHALSVEFLGTAGGTPKTAAGGGETGKESKVPTLGRVVYEDLWKGISLTYEAREGGIAESTYRVRPWTDISKIRLGYNVPVEVQTDGSLKYKFESGYLSESSPMAWQEIGGERVPVEVAFRVKGGEVGFSIGEYDPGYPLTIDPTYTWHTFCGSSSNGYGIAIDASGNIYVTGNSWATWNGPAGQTPLNAFSGSDDIFVLKLNSSGTYQWHTFYGSDSSGSNIAVDGNGNIYVAGGSFATWNGPAGQAPLHAYSGGGVDNIFVLKLNSSGAYQWHTFYGYASYGSGIAMDGSGNIYVTGGSSTTWNGPSGQSPLNAYSGSEDIFVLKLSSGGTYQWHTFHGSSSNGRGIALDGGGNVYVSGESGATWNGPSAQVPLNAYSGGYDAFVLKLSTSGTYQWHTFYGSSTNDWGSGIAVDGSGNVYVTGESTATWNGPSGQAPLNAYSGGSQVVFVLKLISSGAYQWHTFYGPSSGHYNSSYGIALDGSGNMYVTGYSTGTWNGPAGQAPQYAYSGSYDIFLLKLESSGAYRWHTFYGSGSQGYDIAVDGSGNVYVTGNSTSTWNGPAGQAPVNVFGGSSDIFVLKLSNAPSRCDFDGDGKTDLAIYRKSTGAWFYISSSTHTPAGAGFGGDPSDIPVPGDYDGDGKTDYAIYRLSTGAWFIYPSKTWIAYGVGFGGDASDKPVPGDYDGDGKTDLAIYRKSTGAWFIYPSKGGAGAIYGVGFGGDASDIAVPADYDGDGKTDLAIYRKSTGAWFIYPSKGGAGAIYGVGFGGDASDIPVPGDYDGDGKADLAIYRKNTGAWFIYPSKGGAGAIYGIGFGGDASDIPVPADYDGDGKTDLAIYRKSTGAWFIYPSSAGAAGIYGVGFGGDASDQPVIINPGSYM